MWSMFGACKNPDTQAAYTQNKRVRHPDQISSRERDLSHK